VHKYSQSIKLFRDRWKLDLELLGAIALAVLITANFSGFNRPLWYDEYLHFALAGISWTDALALMTETSPNINHGQTWFQQILSIGLLQVFGASTIGLRGISWIASVALFLASFSLLRAFAVPFVLRTLFASLLVLIPTISFEIGNSRFYILLLAATALTARGLVSTLTLDARTKFNKTIFATGVILGSFSHPYFPVILVGLFIVVLVVRLVMRWDLGLSYLRQQLFYLGFAILSGSLSIVVGSISWMTGSPDFSYMDPFEWLPFGLMTFVALTLAFIVFTIGLSFWALYQVKIRSPDLNLVLGFSLMVMGAGLSLLFSWISLQRNYWVLPRQWLAGALLVLFGVTLLMTYLFQNKVFLSRYPKKLNFLKGLVLTATSMFFSISAYMGFVEVRQNIDFWSGLSPAGLASLADQSGGLFIFAGNLNIKCGGKVWSEHSQFYAPGLEPVDLIERFMEEYQACENR